jgi:hypothetical protein
MKPSMSATAQQQLAAQVRQWVVTQAAQTLQPLLLLVRQRLIDLLDQAAPSREMQVRRDTWNYFQRNQTLWHDGTVRAWQAALKPAVSAQAARLSLDAGFELVGTDVVENRILASRLALGVMEKAASQVNDLRKRLKFLQGDRELTEQDIVHPEALILPLVEQWVVSGMSRDSWVLVHETVQQHLNQQLQRIYAGCNEALIERGVLPVIEFVTRSHAQSAPSNMAVQQESVEPAVHDEMPSRQLRNKPVAGHFGAVGDVIAAAYQGVSQGSQEAYGSYGGGHGQSRASLMHGSANRAARSSPAMRSPRERAGRAKGMLDRIGQMLGLQAAQRPGFADTVINESISGSLLQALEQQQLVQGIDGGEISYGPQLTGAVQIERVVSELRKQSSALKEQATTDGEKAIIELVALMFQSILQEDRLPSGIRVWFARLQMPVLRIALSEADFFSRLDHPARQLIDHMGSCVMGFDASGISSSALETEIKRVVQVIEQYPETGERVYQKVYEEFQSFLKNYLTQKPSTLKMVGVAEQVEQKETLTIQYTIELRNQLKDMPVRDEIREFLYKVWAEVMALSAVRQGPQHAETLLLKKTASDLIWAASAKPNRADRARVIADLPELLQCLRMGMNLLGVVKTAQELHVKLISDILADAFMSKTQAIGLDQIKALAERLANLEDYVSDDSTDELPLDAQTIEDLLGIDASELEVIVSGGASGSASASMLEWAAELDLGAWFTLNHNGKIALVQFVWRSPLGHLHLFASNIGRSYLIQTARLAAYLQAGLLEPQEDESLTVRATRDALGKLEANPERLLS